MSTIGDVRFEHALERIVRWGSRLGGADTEDLIQALAALGRHADPLLANVVATELLNRARGAATALDTLGEGVVAMAGDGRVVYANAAAHRLLGWAPGTLVGQDFHAAVHARGAEEAADHHRCLILRALLEDDAGAATARNHDFFERRDGERFFVGYTAAPIRQQDTTTGVAIIFRDVTPDIAREEELALLHEALDHVEAPVVCTDRDGRFRLANAAATRHFGRDREDLLRSSVFGFDLDLDRKAWERLWEDAAREGSRVLGTHHHTRGQPRAPVLVKARHVEHAGRESLVLVIERRREVAH